MMPLRTVSVLGAGSWGTALSLLLSSNIERVVLWGRNADELSRARKNRCNERYLPGVRLPDNLEIEVEFARAIHETHCFVIATPSHGFRSTLEALKSQIRSQSRSLEQATVIWGTKGFDCTTGELLSKVANDVLGQEARTGVISGPSFARETAMNLPTALTVASDRSADAEMMANWFRTPTTRVYYSDDLIGVQLGGAIKNVMAIAAGISDGLGYGANARAALITRGLSELTRLGLALGGKPETFAGLTGVGDLILTCTDDQSRNRRFGLGLGQGRARQQVIDDIAQEIEGILTTRELYSAGRKHGIDMPITEQTYKIIFENTDPASAVKSLLSRGPKAETH